MAGDWIPVRLDLQDDPAVIEIAALLRQSRPAVIGSLVVMWSWFSRHTVDGQAAEMTPTAIDRLVGRRGFALAVLQVGWLQRSQPRGLAIPHFQRWLAQSAKVRCRELLKKRKQRVNQHSLSPPVPDLGTSEGQPLISLSSYVDEEERGRGGGEEGSRSASDLWITFCESLAVACPNCPKWFPPWAARHAQRFSFGKENDPVIMADWWADFARSKVTEAELEESSRWLRLSDKPPKGRPDHPRMLLARIARQRNGQKKHVERKESLPSPEQRAGFTKQISELKRSIGKALRR